MNRHRNRGRAALLEFTLPRSWDRTCAVHARERELQRGQSSARLRCRSPRGMVLILVLVVVSALSLGALAFSELMVRQRETVHLVERQAQAGALAESGLEAAKLLLTEQPDVRYSNGEWLDNGEWFRGVLVLDDEDARGRGRFAVVAPAPADDMLSGIRFGLECESAKLNLNTLLSESSDAAEARDRLMGLPGMMEETADAILDWLDDDDEPREFGAEAPYYESLAAPYRPANGPLRRIEELLHVRGVTRELLFGADVKQTGVPDSPEFATLGLPDDRGWAAYLTLHSRELDRRPDGRPKIDLNQDDLENLYTELEEAAGPEWAAFIVGYRQQEEPYDKADRADASGSGRGSQSTESDPPEDNPDSEDSPRERSDGEGDDSDEDDDELEYEDRITGQLDLSRPAGQTLESVLDLVGQSIRIEYVDREKPVVVSPLFPDDREAMRDYLPALLECATVDASDTPAGRVNVNLAPAAVLSGVPGIDADLAAQIVAHRPSPPADASPAQQTPAWLLIEGLVTLDEMRELLPRLTTGGSVYRAQVIGFFDEGGPVVRLEAVLDATTLPVRVISWKDLTVLGRGFQPEELGAMP